ncbi:hypothetical protein EDD29_4475 [Actinocorallia herbida]|uniref:DUF5134 domain-containing protein n=1 Tax=Actinocorallia herbida TaxID=58109 RepID=A0A3N1D053_9ACTN|nr:hypothetical protein [Actinocorallia herbida]ROO86892.1 hypothetical protein EDD29_4475 [Actinocorallia herbida]
MHFALSLIGCLLALAPAFLPSTAKGDRWPHVAMALGMATAHLGTPTALLPWTGVLILLAAGWSCGSPGRRALNGRHTTDLVLMAVLLTLTTLGTHRSPVTTAATHHHTDLLAPLALLLATTWTLTRLATATAGLLTPHPRGTHLCAAGMAGSMALMAAAH